VPDETARFPAAPRPQAHTPVLLFVGILRESKGVLDLLDACGRVRGAGVDFSLRLVGEFAPPTFEAEVRARIDSLGLASCVQLPGPRFSDDKWREFAVADVFCFPTFFEHESLPGVIIEAMQFALPVVATRWRGIPSMVDDGRSGFLAEVHDIDALAGAITRLCADPELRRETGSVGRAKYERTFTDEAYRRTIERAICAVRD
jgi:glycosyltransferase involved in cell wall biosynthesis